MEPFYTKDGKEVSTIKEMAEALKGMSQEDFEHHVSAQKNDVAIWIGDVHKNEELSNAIFQAPDKETMITLLEEVTNVVFPDEDYHPATGFGKDDADIHKTYENPEEWNAAKEAAHPEENVENPAKHEDNNLEEVAKQHNQEAEQSEPNLLLPETQSVEDSDKHSPPSNPLASESDVKEHRIPDKEQLTHGDSIIHPVPDDLNPQEQPNKKQKIILIGMGVIIGIIIGFLISLVVF